MVNIIPSLLALSASMSLVFAHAGHSALEKRDADGPTGCNAPYAPVPEGSWPTLDCTPFTQDPQVQEWLKLVDFSKTPVYPPSNDGLCPENQSSIPADQCWWTCQKCDVPEDITFCPKAGTWGLTYDDGPSPDSSRLYDALLAHKQKATLFVVGSRAVSYPETLKRAYNDGHQIAIHTWSHPSMTGLTNEQIVAELKWTEKAIFSIIGVTPLYWRPPYGDVDNRVRNIATQLGLKTSIWTQDFDTNDWNIPAGTATPQSVIDTFKAWLTKIPTMKTGFIVLEHDLFPQEVDVSLNGILPLAYADKNLSMMPIAQCLGDGKPYKEGAGTFVLGPNSTTVSPSTSATSPFTTTTPASSSKGTVNSVTSLSATESLRVAGSLAIMVILSTVAI